MGMLRPLYRQLTRTSCSPRQQMHGRFQGFARELATTTGNGDGGDGGLFSWVDKVKGVFKGKASSTEGESASTAAATAAPSTSNLFSLLNFADEMKKARRIGSLAQVLKMAPQVDGETVTQTFEKYEKILRALANHDPTGQHVTVKQKADVALECRCTPLDVDKALAKYEVMKKAYVKVQDLQQKGEPMPQTMEEMQELLGGVLKPSSVASPSKGTDQGRNSLCGCGSGKKYKRCCGKGA